SAAGADEQREMLDGSRAGIYTLIYVAPERFRRPRFVGALRATAGRLGRIAALTATPTPDVRRDIAAQLSFASPPPHVRGFDRPNLHYAVERVGAGDD